MGVKFSSIPINSVILAPEGARVARLEKALGTSDKVQNILFSQEIGVYIQSLARDYGLQPNQAVTISYLVLRVAIGELELAQLPSALSSETKLPTPQASKLASDIENEILAPIKGELRQQRQGANTDLSSKAEKEGAKNIVNLKSPNQPKPPSPTAPPSPSDKRPKYPLPPRVNRPNFPPT